jgi:peroxiredoxin
MNRARAAVRLLFALAATILVALPVLAQTTAVTFADQEKAIAQQIRNLRQTPDDQRAVLTRKLALDIRNLPMSAGKVRLATGLANLSTEGDFGHDTLQEVTNTLAAVIQESEPTGKADALPYEEIARLVRYEGTQTSLKSPKYLAAMADLESMDRVRGNTDFTLTDLQGTRWTLKDLRGKVVVVNFWATWCPPCRKEIADLERLYDEFKGQGLVILGVSDDDVNKLKDFAAKQKVNYPVLPDPGRKVHTAFHIEGIPATLIFDRDGKLAAQAIDMRTRQQFLHLLAQAGLKY